MKTGCIHVPFPDGTPHAASLLVGTTPSPPRSRIERPDFWLLNPPADQLAQNCCSEAMTDGLWARAQRQGSPILRPSPPFFFAVAQLTALPQKPIDPNLGTSLRALLQGMSDTTILATARNAGTGEGWGIVPEIDYPETLENLSRMPPDDVWREGEGATIRDYAIVPDDMQDADALVEELIRQDHFPLGCLFADEAFRDIGEGVYDEPGGAFWGAHCVLFSGAFEPHPTDPELDAFEIRNSWGPAWARGGYCWLSRRFVRSKMFGRLAVTVAPAAIGLARIRGQGTGSRS